MGVSRIKKLKKFIKNNREKAIEHVNKSWDIKRFTEQDIFYMVVFCLLVPGGNAKRAGKALDKLKELNYCYTHLSDYRLFNLLKPLVRFPKQKFKRVKAFKKDKTRTIAEIQEFYKKNRDINELRELLVNKINGFGYKASSHFLRNMGIKDLAIIDTHVMKYKKYFLPEDLQKIKPNSEKNYKIIEKHFNKWAKEEFNLKPAYLDWCLWCLEAKVDIKELTK